VALASGNRVMGFLFEAMSQPLREGFFISQAGNGRAAGEAMRIHLKDTERDIRVALSQLARRPGSLA
jgi:GntR family transcriptional repressor for pyruvate dehydrogenase complex